MINYKYIQVEKVGFRAYMILNRSEKRNAFTPTMVNEIHHAFELFNNDEDIKIVLIKAKGSIFCAGMDLNTFNNPALDITNPRIKNINISLGEVFDKLHKPSIAIVEGNVIAGGFLILLGCTYVFCKPEVQFRLPELALGIFPFQVMSSLLKVLPEKKVLQLCLETDYFDLEKAISLGIVDDYLNEDNLEKLINSFSNTNSKILSSGIVALRHLSDLSRNAHFSYLKSVLDSLKMKS